MDTPTDKHPPFSFGSEVHPGLAKLIEEAGEMLRIAGKLVMTGGVSPHYSGLDLVKELNEELCDLQAALDFYLDHNEDAVIGQSRYHKKGVKYREWHNETPEHARIRLARVADT